MKFMNNPNTLDYILHFTVGALNPVFLLLSAASGWNTIITPLCSLGMLYGGCTSMIALRKKLVNTPDVEITAAPGNAFGPRTVVDKSGTTQVGVTTTTTTEVGTPFPDSKGGTTVVKGGPGEG